MKQADYYTIESDHKLNLPDDNAPLTATHDRIMVNHVDGSIKNDQLNFTYNHEPVFDGGYTPQRDLNIVKYGLEVIGAVATSGHIETVSAALSPDAVLTLVLAATAFSSYRLVRAFLVSPASHGRLIHGTSLKRVPINELSG